MKANFKKLFAVILVIIFCASAAVTGIAVSAAAHSNAAFSFADVGTKSTGDFSRPALKNGVWQAVYQDGHSMYFFINDEEKSFCLINPELGIGVPSRYEYISAIGMYQMHVGSEDNELSWRIIDNDGAAASVSNENGELLTLYYISNDTVYSYHYYTYDELCTMARAYYEANHGADSGITFTARLKTDGTNLVVINADKNGLRRESYIVNIETGVGVDNAYRTIDLNLYADAVEI